MPWKKCDAMTERIDFVLEAIQDGANVSELCRRFGVSRNVGHKWIRRFLEQGIAGLEERSRRPKSALSQTSEELICAIVRYRLERPARGASKIREYLLKRYCAEAIPSVRTINRILSRAELQQKRQRRIAGPEPTWRISPRDCNDVWTADGKGWWRTKDGKRCEPLTIRDAWSRYLLDITAMHTLRSEAVKDRFRLCFEQHGLPHAILTDNGVPFASSRSLLQLSKLSAWWVKLGIEVLRIPPGKPQCNGGHERMHLDIAQEVETNPAQNIVSQQRVLDEWREEFNYERSHDALQKKTPAEVYRRSIIKYNPREPEFEYPSSFEIRKVDCSGMLFWKNCHLFLSRALAGQYVGFEHVDDRQMVLWYCNLQLGKTDQDFRSPLTPIGVRQGETLTPS